MLGKFDWTAPFALAGTLMWGGVNYGYYTWLFAVAIALVAFGLWLYRSRPPTRS